MTDVRPVLIALVFSIAVAVGVPLAILGRSFELNLRSMPSPAEKLEGHVWWSLGSIFVLAVAVLAAGIVIRSGRSGSRTASLCGLITIGTAGLVGFAAQPEADYGALVIGHAAGLALILGGVIGPRGVRGKIALSCCGALLVVVFNWAAAFLE